MTARTTDLFIYPVGGLSGQRLEEVTVGPDRGFPLDRYWTLAKHDTETDSLASRPVQLGEAHSLSADPRLGAVTTHLDPEDDHLTVTVRGRPVLDCVLTGEGVHEAEKFFARILDLDDAQAPHLVRREGKSFNYSYTASLSEKLTWACHLINLASLRALEEKAGCPVDPARFRANIIVDLGEPWIENDLVGKTFQVGDVEFRGEMTTPRCAATEVDLRTGRRDIPVPRLLKTHFDTGDFGIYATVVTSGTVRPGDPVVVA